MVGGPGGVVHRLGEIEHAQLLTGSPGVADVDLLKVALAGQLEVAPEARAEDRHDGVRVRVGECQRHLLTPPADVGHGGGVLVREEGRYRATEVPASSVTE